MQQDNQLTPAERELEEALRQLHPAGHAIDRDRLMFTAGLRTAQRGQRRWQAATATLTVLLAASWALRLAVPAAPPVAEAPPPAAPAVEVAEVKPPPLPPLPPLRQEVAAVPEEAWPPLPQYVHIRNRVVDEGPEALQDMQLAAAATRDQDTSDDLDGYLREQGIGYPRAFGLDRDIGG